VGSPSRIVLVGGGVRSGKSAFALLRAEQLGTRRVFVATAEVRDEEMHARVARHKAERAGRGYRNLEVPRELAAALRGIDDADVVVVDCLTLWLSNLLLDGLEQSTIAARVRELCAVLEVRKAHAILVSNEVGLGIVPDNALARAFRDVAGSAHQQLGRIADEVYVGVFGQLLRLKPGSVALVETRGQSLLPSPFPAGEASGGAA
jgi:adenosylcobinamide kinase / adenosylcobinamide-phosphate guanylyltransferase